MNKVYILVPLIGCIIFYGVYFNFSRGYEAKIAARKVAEAAAIKDKQIRDIAAREQAIKDAIAAQEKRKLERLEKEKRDEEEKKAQLDLEDKRTSTFEERKRFRQQVDNLKKELTTVQEEMKKLEDERKRHADEEAFLKTYVKQAEANTKYYYDLLDKIAAAEAAKAAAEAAAKAASKG